MLPPRRVSSLIGVASGPPAAAIASLRVEGDNRPPWTARSMTVGTGGTPAEARGRVVSAGWALIKSAQVWGRALVQGALIVGIGAGRTLAASGAVLVLACLALAAVRPRLGVPARVPAVASRSSD